MTDKMPDEMNYEAIACTIADKFPDLFDLEGQDYGRLHDLEYLAKDIEQKHAEEIEATKTEWYERGKAGYLEAVAALKAEHRAEMVGLCDEIERLETHTSEDGNLIYLVHIDDVLAVIKQRISDEKTPTNR